MRVLLFIIAFLCTTVAHAAVTVSVNGSNHTIPETNEKGWGSNVTAWIQSISQYTLQPSGGTFSLTAEVYTGATYGFKVPYIKSATSNPASAGVLRLAESDSMGWRNNANGADLLLAVDNSDRLTFNSSVVPTATSASFQDSTFSIYDNGDSSKLIAFQASGISGSTTRTITMPDANVNLGALTNSNIDAAAAIAYTKLNLGTSIVNADVSASAAIDVSKLAALTASRVAITDGSGVLSAADTGTYPSLTELSYVKGLTSAAQTQIDAKVAKSTLTTKGDIYVATGASTVVRQGIGTDGFILMADSGQTNGLKWAAPGASTAYDYRSITSADSAVVGDYILLSGASFTITLPTAAGFEGEQIVLQHGGTSLTQVYTIATTSSQTVGGVASTDYKLHTNGEVLELVSDGSNWLIKTHKTETGWVSSGVIGIGATTTPPTKASGITIDRMMWRREGTDAVIHFEYKQSNTTSANAGSGDYLFSIPANMTLDTNFVTVYGGAAIGTNTFQPTNQVGTGQSGSNAGQGMGGIISMYDSTQFRMATTGSASNGTVGSSWRAIDSTNVTYTGVLRIPISGWRP